MLEVRVVPFLMGLQGSLPEKVTLELRPVEASSLCHLSIDHVKTGSQTPVKAKEISSY